MFKKISIALVFLLSLSSCAQQIANSEFRTMTTSLYKYLLYLPEDYGSGRSKNYPLIIYLHGKSASGNDLKNLKRYGIPFFIEQGMKFKAIVVSPQCPSGKNWTAENWFESLFKELTEKYDIDTNRIYLTGMSMGGFGAWYLAIKYPDRFAAVVPLCGGGNTQKVCVLKDISVWVFHGSKDELIPMQRSEEMVEALRKCGGSPKFTVLYGQGHDIHRTYANEKIYNWMYRQKK